MSLVPADNSPTDRRSLDHALGYAAITIFVLLSYVAVLGRYENFVNGVLPAGDPFTYTIGWFWIIDQARAEYFQTLLLVFQDGNWYRLLNMEIALLSPILTKDPAVLCIVNYLIWGLGTAAYFRLGLAMGLGAGRAFAVALIPWLWPVNYGFIDYASIPVLGLDAAFTGALLLALGNSFVFALNPRHTVNGIVAALSIGVAVWGRGNSAPIVALVVGWPCLLAVWNAGRLGDRRAWLNVAVAAILAAAMTIEFYRTYWGQLFEYYSGHVRVVDRHHWNLHDAMPYLKNIPGFMYWRSEDSWLTMGLSWVSHFVPILALGVAWRSHALAPQRRDACRQLAIAGALIYFGTYLTNLVLWNDPVISLENGLFIWEPMLIGLSLSVIVLFLRVTERIKWDLRMLLPAGAVMLTWGVVWTAYRTPSDWAVGRPSPRVVERFAVGIDQMLEDSGQLSVLWYENWNPVILQYYRAQDDLPEPPLYIDQYWGNIWSLTDYSPENRAIVLEEITQNFLKAGMVIVPEYLDDYPLNGPYAFYHFKHDWANWVNSPEAPRLRVRMLLQESPNIRLLVLQREELAHGRGDPFRLPWGARPETPPDDYSDQVVRFK